MERHPSDQEQRIKKGSTPVLDTTETTKRTYSPSKQEEEKSFRQQHPRSYIKSFGSQESFPNQERAQADALLYQNQVQNKDSYQNQNQMQMVDSNDFIQNISGSIDQSQSIAQIREIEQMMQRSSEQNDRQIQQRGLMPQTITSEDQTTIEQMGLTGQHPLSVYFKDENAPADVPREQAPNPITTSFGRRDDSMSEHRQQVSNGSDLQFIDTRDQYIDTRDEHRIPQSATLSPPGAVQIFTESDKINVLGEEDQIKSSGLQTIFGSIEQSPKNHKTGSSFGNVNNPPKQKSVQLSQNRAFSSLNSQSVNERDDLDGMSGSQNANGDNYNFLGGIREVEDDEETLGGQRSAAKSSDMHASHNKNWDGSFKGSIYGSMNNEQQEQAPVNMYGTQGVTANPNPFIQNLQQQALWSSGKSSSDQQLSFGGGFGQQAFGTSEPSLNMRFGDQIQTRPVQVQEDVSPVQSQSIEAFHQELDQQDQYSPRNRLLQKVYNQALAQMGEKACMRMTMKELVVLLDELNQSVCKQSVHQEIIMSEENPSAQMKQIMDLSLREQKSSAKKERDMGTVDSGESMNMNEKQKELLESLKRKSNLQLIESVRMDFKLIQIRFNDFLTRENNIYSMLAKERERNEVLQEELQKYENQGMGSSLGPSPLASIDAREPYPNNPSFINIQEQANYQLNTNEKSPSENRFKATQDTNFKKYNDNLTIEQLSPVPAFKRDSQVDKVVSSNLTSLQDHFYSVQNQETILEDMTNQTYNMQNSLDLMKKLEDKDKQINLLNDFVENLKYEINSLRQPIQQNIHYADAQSEQTQQTVLRQNEKLVELHTTIYNLKRKNSYLEEQLIQESQAQFSTQTPINQVDEVIKVQDDIERLKTELDQVSSQLGKNNQSNSQTKKLQSSASIPESIYGSSHPNSQLQSIQQEEMVDNKHQKISLGQMPNERDNLTMPRESQIRNRGTISQASGVRTAQTSVIKIGAISVDDGTDREAQTSMTQQQQISQHVLEQQQIQQQEFRNLQGMADTLNQKLREQLRINQDLALSEKQLKEKLASKDAEYAEIRVLARDLQSQGTVNSEALEKAGKVIQKLNNDLQQSLDAAAQIQSECQQYKDDNFHKRQQLQEMEITLKQSNEANDSKIQRIDNELNLEIKELREALSQYQKDTDQEKEELQTHIQDLTFQNGKMKSVLESMETKAGADQKQLSEIVAAKTMEALDLHDQNLSLKIEMNKLEQQLEQDIDVREQLNKKQNIFLKNQVNDLQVKLNSTRAKSRSYGAGQSTDESLYDQDGEAIPKVNQAYLNTLQIEFQKLSKELHKIRQMTFDKSQENLDSFLQRHISKFDEFKKMALEGVADWHQKTAEHSRLAKKYHDTLEEYKMLFIQMKQVIKEKDSMVVKMREALHKAQRTQGEHFDQIQATLMQTRDNTVLSLKKLAKLQEMQLKVKEGEVEELLRYQEEFRQEYIKLCSERDGLVYQNKDVVERMNFIQSELEVKRKQDFDYKEKLRTTLMIEESPHAYDIVTQHIEKMVDDNKALKMQLSHYQEKSKEMALELENQRGIFQTKMSEMERQLEQSQGQYLEQQNDLQEEFLQKEHEFEARNTDLAMEVEKLSQELEVRERQIRKHDQKIQQEVDKQLDLQKTIDAMTVDQDKLIDTKNAVKESYDILERKMDDTNRMLDKRTQEVDDLSRKLKSAYQTMDKVEFDLSKATADLQNRAAAVERLDKELANERDCLHHHRQELMNIQDLNGRLVQENNILKESETKLMIESTKSLQIIKDLNSQCEDDARAKTYLESEIKRYQDSLSFQCHQLDNAALQENQMKALNSEIDNLREIVKAKENEIVDIYARYVNKPRSSICTQTDHSGMAQLEQMGQEIYNQTVLNQELEDETQQLREAMRRQMNDIDRLIDEKRQLEQEIEFKNSQIHDIKKRVGQENINYQNQRHRSNSPDNMSHSINQHSSQQDMILKENQNYISNLERELNELRIENEKLKDKVIVYELEQLGGPQLSQSGIKQRGNKSGILGFTNTLNDRTLADSRSNISATQNFSHQNMRGHHKNFTQKFGPVRFDNTQGTQSAYRTDHESQPYNQANHKSFDRSLNFTGIPLENQYHTSQQEQQKSSNVANPDYFYTLQQSEDALSNSRQDRTPVQIVDARKSSPLRMPTGHQFSQSTLGKDGGRGLKMQNHMQQSLQNEHQPPQQIFIHNQQETPTMIPENDRS